MFDFDLLQTNEDAPTLITALITILLSFFLSSIIAITYEFTDNSIERKTNFLQSMVLVSIVTSMIMLAIGDSLAVGLGMLGALSIIRFRTSINDPRNITFVFISLGIGISCGILAFNVAVVGTLIFCVVSFLLQYSSWGKTKIIAGRLQILYESKSINSNQIVKILEPFIIKHQELDITVFKASENVEGESISRNYETTFFIELINYKQLSNLKSLLTNNKDIIQFKFSSNIKIGKF